MCRKKRRLYNKAKRTKKDTDWDAFYSHQRATNSTLKKSHWGYVNNILQQGLETGNRNSFWSYVKSLQQDAIGVSPLRVGRQLFADAGSKARTLNAQFQSVFTRDTPENADIKLHEPKYPSIPDLSISPLGVRKLLADLNPSKASGPDQIPARLLKNLAEELAPAITVIFKQSLNDGELPDPWKKAWIAPVFKKGNRNEPSNYRLVSQT